MKVLIVVDMQYDFCGPEGSLSTPEAQAIVPKVAETIKQMADKNTVIIFTKDTHFENYIDTLEGKNLPVPHCIKGTMGHSIVDEVLNAYIDVIDKYADPYKIYPITDMNPIHIEKPTFGSIELQNILYDINENYGIEEITLMGIDTSICVLSNAILCKATLPETTINVIADCCSSVTLESHKTALEAMKMCQINII